eukprot:1973350-Prymnesium_polylepis.1
MFKAAVATPAHVLPDESQATRATLGSPHRRRLTSDAWNATAPGDFLAFVTQPGSCAGASSLPASRGGLLDANMETTVRLTIPPD